MQTTEKKRSRKAGLEVRRVSFQPAWPGQRAVFMVEVPTKRHERACREIFELVGALAEVVSLSHGRIQAYAVQSFDPDVFTRLDQVLKARFPFSVVESGWSEVTYELLQTFAADGLTRLNELPLCCSCLEVEPFPSRASLEVEGEENPLPAAYCLACVARHWRSSTASSIRRLVSHDHRRPRVRRDVPVTMMRPMSVESDSLREAI